MKKAKKFPDLALGSYEAAGVMGIHFTRPRLMAEAGKLMCRQIGSRSKNPRHVVAVFSMDDCERDYREYCDRVEAAGGKHYRRPRAWLHLRPEALRRLKTAVPIEYADACSVREAMEILRCNSTSLVTRMLNSGELIGRKAWNPRYKGKVGDLWIISRRSVEERKKKVVAWEASGKKPGIRKFIAKK